MHSHVYCWVTVVLIVCASICYAGTHFHRIAYIDVATDDWANYQQLFDGTYTHIITAFLVPDSAGGCDRAIPNSTVEYGGAQDAGRATFFSLQGESFNGMVEALNHHHSS
jgi:hypothetical protein